jgi:SnoaL-like domain
MRNAHPVVMCLAIPREMHMKLRTAATAIALALTGMATSTIARPVVRPAASAQVHLLDRVAIEDLLATYLYRLDHGQTDKLAELFAEDGVMDVENVGALKGHAAIAAYYEKRSKTRTTRHIMTNLYIEFDDATHARTSHTLTYFAGEGAGPFPATPSGVADYSNIVVRGSDGKWRIQYRKPTPIFGFRPGQSAPAAQPSK